MGRGDAFEDEVARLLRLRGFSVDHDRLVAGTQVDLIATKSHDFENLVFLVECNSSDDNVGVGEVKEKYGDVAELTDRSSLFSVLFVAKVGFTKNAHAYAEQRPALHLRTIDELANELLDLRPYADAFVRGYESASGTFEAANLMKGYVPLAGSVRGTKDPLDLWAAVTDWFASDTRVLFLLGEYGSGKTSFCHHLTYRSLVEPNLFRSVPILIPLREHGSAQRLGQLVTNTLVNEYGVKLPSFRAFEQFAGTGRITLILDGLDEMSAAPNRTSLAESLAQILALARIGPKTIVSCRTNYFTSAEYVLDLVRQIELTLPDGTTAATPLASSLEVMEVRPFDRKNIKEYITKTTSDPEHLLEQMAKIHDLTDLATRPVLLNMIVTTLVSFGEGEKVDAAKLYETYTSRWTARDNWRVALDASVRHRFCDLLAWGLHSAKRSTVTLEELQRLIDELVATRDDADDQRAYFLEDISVCSFLVPGRPGEFAFAHRSFMEFFVARVIAGMLMGIDPSSLSPGRAVLSRPAPIGANPDMTDQGAILPTLVWRSDVSLVVRSETFRDLSSLLGVSRPPAHAHTAVVDVRQPLDQAMAQVASRFALNEDDDPGHDGWGTDLSPEINAFVIEILEQGESADLRRSVQASGLEAAATWAILLRDERSSTVWSRAATEFLELAGIAAQPLRRSVLMQVLTDSRFAGDTLAVAIQGFDLDERLAAVCTLAASRRLTGKRAEQLDLVLDEKPLLLRAALEVGPELSDTVTQPPRTETIELLLDDDDPFMVWLGVLLSSGVGQGDGDSRPPGLDVLGTAIRRRDLTVPVRLRIVFFAEAWADEPWVADWLLSLSHSIDHPVVRRAVLNAERTVRQRLRERSKPRRRRATEDAVRNTLWTAVGRP